MTPDDRFAALREGLAGPLPGPRAQKLMAPHPRPGWRPDAELPSARPAAVLVLLYPGSEGDTRIVFTERTADVASHKSQVSFPGGGIEPGESHVETACREAEEEIGLARGIPRPLGELTPLWVPATGFTIHPVVAIATERPVFVPNPREVRRILETDLAHLRSPDHLHCERSNIAGRWLDVPYFDLAGARLWGASAMITAELLALLGWPGPPWLREGQTPRD